MHKGVFQTGAEIDYRTGEQKARDYNPKEAFASATPVHWREKSLDLIQSEIFAVSIYQGSTLRCVSEYAGIALETAEFLETGKQIAFSRRDVYCRRANRPNGGMAMHDLFAIMREGSCYESQLPSTDLLEHEINKEYSVTDEMMSARKMHASGSSFTWNMFNIDDIARTLEMKIPVCLFWYFNNSNLDEWWNEAPKALYSVELYAPETGRHQATAVSFCLVGGKKHLVVMDSAGQGTGLGKQKNLRLVSEDFFSKRCYGAGFAIDKKNLDYKPPATIQYNFTRNLKNGMSGEDVVMLQKILVLEGCLSLKTPTGRFLGMTEAGVTKLQEKYANEILKPLGLKKGTGRFYESTRKFINQKYK